jgi:hypothetical protein
LFLLAFQPLFFITFAIQLLIAAVRWENPEDVSTVAIEYRALAMKLERWMEHYGK